VGGRYWKGTFICGGKCRGGGFGTERDWHLGSTKKKSPPGHGGRALVTIGERYRNRTMPDLVAGEEGDRASGETRVGKKGRKKKAHAVELGSVCGA